ncbi:MAG: xylulokinase [Eubacteriales bacterium]
MKYYIGADLGTSALKLLLVSESGEIVRSVSRTYPVAYPQPGWSEQRPEDWWDAFAAGVRQLTEDFDAGQIAGIGLGGQMHGLVILDENDRVIRPAILWNDGRTAAETAWLNEAVGREKLTELTGNIAFAGFTAPKLLWLREKEPDSFCRIRRIMLPKDYVNYRLTGVHASDYSDASGTLMLDVKHRRWSREMLDICGVREEQMPQLYESYAPLGGLLPEVAAGLGLSDAVVVVAGAGDNAAAAVGTGTVSDGKCNISVGTSGTIFISSDRFPDCSPHALHAFCHADGGYHLMGCMLSAASCSKWLCEGILRTADYKTEEAAVSDDMLGGNHVYFLPYLMGERSPINDTDARGVFAGMRLDTKREELVQAVLEGVAFAFRDNLEAAREAGVTVDGSSLCGGGARSLLWRKILCNVLNIPLHLPRTEEGPAYGGAMLAMTGCGAYESVRACADALVREKESVLPDPQIAARYERQYRKFRQIYPAMKPVFQKIK